MLPDSQLTIASGFPHTLFDDPDNFLADYGFHRVLVPSEGDIVAYVRCNEPYVDAQHFGILREGKVLSKFGVGHIFRHDIEQVPLSYGEKVIFYGRNQIKE